MLYNVPDTLCDRVLLVGLGKERDFKDGEFYTAIRTAVKFLNETGAYEAVIYLTEEKVRRREIGWQIEHAVIAASEAVYCFSELKTENTDVRRPLRKLTFTVPPKAISAKSFDGSRAGDCQRRDVGAQSGESARQYLYAGISGGTGQAIGARV